ncbi:hypothetical protein TNCV_3923151 [Trichonephila clavipes]|nr:hypothetical protein TNCV_3923151 [Trichonephila clavipes]
MRVRKPNGRNPTQCNSKRRKDAVPSQDHEVEGIPRETPNTTVSVSEVSVSGRHVCCMNSKKGIAQLTGKKKNLCDVFGENVVRA